MAGVIPHLDQLPLWAAFIPLGLYLLAIGAAHLRRRPVAIGGGWDWALLGAAVAGLMVVGPLALLQPAMGNAPWTVILLLVLFVLLVALGALVSRPRLVIYNITLDQLRPLLADVVTALDTSARWAGSTAALPARRLEVRVDGHGPWRTVSLVSGGGAIQCRGLERTLSPAATETGRSAGAVEPVGSPLSSAGRRDDRGVMLDCLRFVFRRRPRARRSCDISRRRARCRFTLT